MHDYQIDKEETAKHEWLRLVEVISHPDGTTMVFEVREEFVEQFREVYGFDSPPSFTNQNFDLSGFPN